MRPKVAIVGRPNVGKSTLFNRLIGLRQAIVHDRPGVTRDRRYGAAHIADFIFDAIDTAGYEDTPESELEHAMQAQTARALDEADAIMLLIDARAGVTPVDMQFAEQVRRSQKPVLLVANKCEGRGGQSGLLEAFGSGEDIHATTAAKVFDLPLDAVDGALRDRAKAVNYGLAYGLTSYGLGQQLGIPPDEAQEIVDAYFDRFPKVRSFLDAAVTAATNDGFTTTMFGRRRYLPDLRSDNRNRRQMAERMALNAPIQGTAADVIKLAMIELQHALDRSGLATQQLLQVHDEVILEVPEGEMEAAEALVVETLSHVVELAVPLDVDTAFGPTWWDTQKH
jgi:small GTP-binding protein